MRGILQLLVGSLLLFTSGCAATPDWGRPLPDGAPALIPLEPGEPIPDVSSAWYERQQALEALDRSRAWLERKHSEKSYPIAGIDHDRALASVVRLGELLRDSDDAAEFKARVEQEFEFYKSAGWDGRGGGVLFTGYYTPIFDARTKPDARFKYPLYAKPQDLVRKEDGTVVWQLANGDEIGYPSRRTLEETDLLQNRGLELAWLEDPFDVYLCHVQGSAFLRVEGGEMLRLGYGGTNGHEYTSLAELLVKADEIEKDHAGIPTLRAWADKHGDRLFDYTRRNERFTFFTKIEGTPHGSLDFPVEADYSLATDKRLFPSAAPTLVEAAVSTGTATGLRPVRRVMFDQDTGGGIRTAGRADIYMGVGDDAGERAGRTKAEGQLYYFFLRPEYVRIHVPRARP
ncbi:MAG: MltA domain-containing protein [Planctomycetota bacterium]